MNIGVSKFFACNKSQNTRKSGTNFIYLTARFFDFTAGMKKKSKIKKSL